MSREEVIIPEMNLEKIIAESREVAQALNEFADDLERIEKKYMYTESPESENKKSKPKYMTEEGYKEWREEMDGQ